eukprot:COSAG01_NODE_717_length_14076_cov_20.354225_7_plen_360_part_00
MVLLGGDLNYRLDLDADAARAILEPCFDPAASQSTLQAQLASLQPVDQLTCHHRQGHALRGFNEAGALSFPPTYKFDIGTNSYDTSAKHRTPSWCDRIFVRGGAGCLAVPGSYVAHMHDPALWVSDHRPVSAGFTLPALTQDGDVALLATALRTRPASRKQPWLELFVCPEVDGAAAEGGRGHDSHSWGGAARLLLHHRGRPGDRVRQRDGRSVSPALGPGDASMGERDHYPLSPPRHTLVGRDSYVSAQRCACIARPRGCSRCSCCSCCCAVCGVRQVTLAEVLGPTAPATLRSLLTPYFIPVVQQPAPSMAPAPPSFPFYAKAQFPFDGALFGRPVPPGCLGWCRDSVFLQGFATAT